MAKRWWLLIPVIVWIGSWVLIFADGGATLTDAPINRVGFLSGEVSVAIFVLILIWLTRHIRPVDDQSDLGIRQPGAEALSISIYIIIVLVVGALIGVRTHVASLGLSDSTLHIWGLQTPQSLLLWAAYYFILGAVLPTLFFVFVRRYSPRTLLLSFPDPKRWVPYALITGALNIAFFAGPDYFRQPLVGHLAALALFSLGTFLPVMILTQSLLAPRLAILTRSWLLGAVLAGVVYGLYHFSEFYLEWTSSIKATVSLAWLVQFMFFGVMKAITTLRTRSAWIHIFNTHTPHLAEVSEVVRILGL